MHDGVRINILTEEVHNAGILHAVQLILLRSIEGAAHTCPCLVKLAGIDLPGAGKELSGRAEEEVILGQLREVLAQDVQQGGRYGDRFAFFILRLVRTEQDDGFIQQQIGALHARELGGPHACVVDHAHYDGHGRHMRFEPGNDAVDPWGGDDLADLLTLGHGLDAGEWIGADVLVLHEVIEDGVEGAAVVIVGAGGYLVAIEPVLHELHCIALAEQADGRGEAAGSTEPLAKHADVRIVRAVRLSGERCDVPGVEGDGLVPCSPVIAAAMLEVRIPSGSELGIELCAEVSGNALGLFTLLLDDAFELVLFAHKLIGFRIEYVVLNARFISTREEARGLEVWNHAFGVRPERVPIV